ncbi:phage tail terminator family protein [Lysinibacillus sp. FSL M8-0355]|uniref:phage tail terminator family protein n=1 Tax=Lysinibacillus sp. FSL M8-0355 TaxID=2921719 RepID=UPI0030F9E595
MSNVTEGIKTLAIMQIRSLYPSMKIYDKPVKQGLKVPAFLVRIFNVHQERGMKYQANRTYSFSMVYFPSTDDIDEECLNVLEVVQNNFKYLADRFHVHEIDGEIVDETLVIKYQVKACLHDILEEVKMRTLEGVDFDTRDDKQNEHEEAAGE